ncbi:MAG TPA: SMP-30/gluconolactonase/LRE family protein [Acidimicrobiia bacterium]|jgi:gluconolactonase|nr:SMP-30/gluconolactonase/LRE family protein [Acidimicrobiia bacterium]
MDGPHVICSGPEFGEGPVWCPPDGAAAEGTLVCTSVTEGTLSRIWPESGRREVIADTGGGANGAALAADGGFLVTQNGGIDFSIFEIFGELPPPRYVPSGLQRVAPDGQVSYLTPPLQMPNDLCVAPDGTVFFTDPLWPPREPPTGRVLALDPDGSMRVAADGFWAPNGIILDTDDETLIVVENGRNGEHHGFVRLRPDGTRELFAPERVGDGGALDVEGRIYMAGGGHVVTIYEPDGTVVEQLECPGDHPVSTNLCFGGPDLRTLFAVDGGAPGHVYCWTGLPTPGRPLPPWPGI